MNHLAIMVAEGFNDVTSRMATTDDIVLLTGRMDKLDSRMDKLDERMASVEHKIEALDSSVKNYLELSDKRYLELRETNRLMFKYLKLVAQKTKVPVDLTELEKLVR